MKTKPTLHLLIRFSDTRLLDGETIARYNAIVHQQGAVWFGKMGSPVSQQHIDQLMTQVNEGIPTYVYLVKGNRRKSTAFKAQLITATRDFPEAESPMIPQYYQDHDIPKYVRFWVKLSEISPITLDELNQMQVASSVLPLAETLVKSATGHFIIREARH